MAIDAPPDTRRFGFDWSAAVWAGIISGVVFMMLEMVMVPVFLGMSGWAPPRMIAAIAMGKGVLPMPGGPPPTFEFGMMMTAMAVHFPLSIIYAIVLAWIIQRFAQRGAIIVGALFGLALYLVNFYGFTAIYPWFAMARNWVSIVSHMVFGVVAAAAYVRLAKRTSRLTPA